MIYWLDPDDRSLSFPDVKHALRDPNGLLALGGDLSAQRLLNAYRKGIFPWYSDNQPILWWSPDPRAVLFPHHLKVSRSLKKKLRRAQFTVTMNKAFNRVIEACAVTPRPTQNGTWITDEIKLAYCKLHEMGYAHSVEAWENEKLVGGLYGIAIGCVFFGESMFMRKTDASKVAFAHMVRWLEIKQFHLIDCQVETEHLKSLGAECIPRSQFILLLDQYCKESCGSLVGEHTLSGEITW